MDREIQQLFASQQATIALKKDGKLIVSQFGRGIGPALSLYDEQPELLRGADVFDTIVGKAAASIFILAGVRSVYGQTMSQSAVQLLTRHGVACSYETVPPQIINRPRPCSPLTSRKPAFGSSAKRSRICAQTRLSPDIAKACES